MSPTFGQGRTYRTVSGRDAVVLAVMPDGRLVVAHVGLSFVPNGDSLDPARVHLRTHDRHGKLIGGEHTMGGLDLVPDLSSGGQPISPAMADAFAENAARPDMAMVKAKVGPNGIPIGPRGFQLGIGGTNIPGRVPPAVPSWFEDDGTIVTPATNEEGVTVRIPIHPSPIDPITEASCADAIGRALDPKPPPDPPHPPPLDYPKPRIDPERTDLDPPLGGNQWHPGPPPDGLVPYAQDANGHAIIPDPERTPIHDCGGAYVIGGKPPPDPERQQSPSPEASAPPSPRQRLNNALDVFDRHIANLDHPDARQPEERHRSIQAGSTVPLLAAVEALHVLCDRLERVTGHITEAERHREAARKLSEIND